MRRQQSVTAMRLRVTPIGAQGASAAKVAADVVDYLEGGRGDPGGALLGGGGGVVGYYADSREGPGRWLGAGAAFQRLSGRVDRDAFHRVLEGRHPVTGARLVTARGSSQRPHLAAGTAARFDELGRALYTVADAARLLGLRHDDVEELVEAGRGGDQDPADRGWLASVEIGGGPLISDAEIARHLELAATVVTASEVLREGDPDELLSVGQAARLLRVTPRYVRRLCSAYLSAETDGDGRRRASLRCHRADDGPAAPYRIRRGDLADFAGRRRPPVAVVGYDLTLTCEKSLAILTMLSDGEAQNRLVRALRVANDTAVAHLDRVASVARKGGAQIRTEGLLAASYFHGTSRALDPHPHHHNVVANAVVDAEGDVRTLDGRALYRHAPAAAALASAAVRWELRDLGVGWWRRDDGVWEISGVDERAIREFSQRHHEVDEIKTVLEERLGRRLSHDEENTVALTTRGPKTRVEVDALRAAWQRRASDVGLDITSCFEHDGEVLVCDVLRCDLTDRLFADLVDPEHGLCATSTTFDRGDVLAMIADWSVVDADGHRRKVLLPPTEVERVADRFCASALVAELAGTAGAGVIRRRDGSVIRDGQAEPLFATVELLEVEHEILRRFAEQSPPRAVVDDTLVEAFVRTGDDDGVVLNGEQAQLVRAWCTSGRAIQAAVGRAGTGKTTTMQAARKAWQAGGFRVVGCAVKGEAARQLAEDAGIEADTVALLLARAAGGQQVLDERSVLIVDEASTLGSRDLVAILRLADTARATVRLIGDTAQHGSVSAGGSFAHLVDLDGDHTPQLTEVHRLRNRAERRRADLIRAGQIERALDELQASGQLRLTDSDADTYAAMLTRWYEHRHAGTAHPMVHGRNRERQLLNQLAQTVLASEGSVALDQAVTLRDGRRLAAGDDVIARRGDRRIYPAGQPKAWMRNGTTGRIVAVHHGGVPDDDRITIRTADGLLNCSRSVFDHRRGGIDLGYAVTSYAVQGSTRDASTSAVTATTARSELYVDITRGRHSNQLYATRTANRDDGEAHLPMLQRELMPTLRQQLARGIVRLASALDPTALAGAHQRRRRSLAALLAARQRREDGGVGRAIDQAIAATRREAQSSPQPTLRAVLPARPASPHLAARWDNFAGDVTVHTAITPAPRRRRRAQTAMEVLLGRRPDVHSESRHRWEELAERGAALAADIVVWQLQQARPPEAASIAGQSWLRPYLANLATNAGLAGVDLPALQQLIGDVDAWRSTHDVPPDDTAILGTIPAEAVDRAQFEQLCRRLRLGASSGGRSVA